MKNLTASIEANRSAILIWAIAALTVFTFVQRYPVDDAFISYRYAQNLVDGHGLVWNIGERLEGYTNFLWTLFSAVGLKVGVAPEYFTLMLSFPIFIGVLYLVSLLGASIGLGPIHTLLAVLLVGINRSVYAFATSGLETPLQMFEFLLFALIIVKAAQSGWTARKALFTSFLIAMAILTRPDGALLGAVALFSLVKSGSIKEKRILIPAILPLFLLIVPFVIWKLSYYGSMLPNSFNVKVRDLYGVYYGLLYIHLFLLSHFLHIPIILLGWFTKKLTALKPGITELFLLTAIWIAYTISVGGDFMEFRFLAPIIPIITILILLMVERELPVKAGWALTVALFLGSIHGNIAMESVVQGYGVESVRQLRGHLNGRSEDWVEIGKKLKEYFGGSNVTISAGAAGAIPYYAGLRTIDFMGLNDPVIPQDNETFSRVPGHRIIAKLDYLYRQGVNLIVEPNNFMLTRREYEYWAPNASWSDVYRYYIDPDKPVMGSPPTDAKLLALPIGTDAVLVTWYLIPHPEIEKKIKENGWQVFQLTRW